MLMRTLLLVGLALVLLAGCGDDDGGAGEKPAGLAGPVTYERGGGVAGRRDRLVVQPDGSAKLTVRTATKSIRLSDAELADLRRELETATSPPSRRTPRAGGRCPTPSATA
jgi:hypothetical protein